MKLLKAQKYTPGSSDLYVSEPILQQINFKIHKFNSRNKPEDKRNIVIIPLFSEFGCETISVVYCLPKLLKLVQGKYSIVMGWHGREFFYKHLVDEMWSIDKDCMWLREYCRAFNHVSRNLKNVEKKASEYGQVVDIRHLSNFVVFPKLTKCPFCLGKVFSQTCFDCGKIYQDPGIFNDIKQARKKAVWLPELSQEKMDKASFLPENAVGITARNRNTWSRNLDMPFYHDLINFLKEQGYFPVWLGEKTSIHPCPEGILDCSDIDDLELTFALVKRMKFTIQFWTASSRLAAMVGTPYIIIESPDQFWEIGQEGYRSNLITKGERKRVFCHYKTAVENMNEFLSIVKNSIIDVGNNNFEDIIGLVENKDYIINLQKTQGNRIGDDLWK